MTASKAWALIVGLVLVGAGVIGATLWRPQVAKVVETAKTELTAPPQGAKPTPNLAKPEVSTLAKPAAPVPDATPPRKPEAEPASGHGEPPHFDVVRVEPTGEAVVAGKGEPNAKVALTEGGQVVAEAQADPAGNFVILPPALTPGAHDLSLQQSTAGKPDAQSQQTVAVSVPPDRRGHVVVALAEPGKPTRVLSKPGEAPAIVANAPTPPKPPQAAAAPAETAKSQAAQPPAVVAAVPNPETAIAPPAAVAPAGPGLAIRTAELENGTGFYATGNAAPRTQVELYLNGAHLASVVAGADGQWSVTIRKGLTGGHYIVRADALGHDRKVTARAEVPFDVPVAMAQAPKPQTPKPEVQQPSPAAPEPKPAEVAANLAPAADAPEPPSAPNPSEVVGVPAPAEAPGEAPLPRPDVAPAGTKAAAAQPVGAAPASQRSDPPAAAAQPAAPEAAKAQQPTGTSPSASSAAPAAEPSANAVVEQVETALVVRGDNLWNISRTKLGHGRRYTQIYAANVSQIRDPKLIYPGQVFVMPHD